MFRNKQEHKNHYGTFTVYKRPFFRNKKVWSSVIFSLLCLIVVSSVGFGLFKKDQKKTSKVEIPLAQASEIPGWWLKDYFGASVCEKDICKPDADPDNDKLSNAQEFYFHSDPLNRDTNGNGLTDGQDVAYNFDPSKPGKVTFEEAASDDEIFGESIVFDKDVKSVISDLTSLDKIKLPEVNETELKVSDKNSKEILFNYIKVLDDTIAKYFPKDPDSYITEVFASSDPERVSDLKIRSVKALIEVKQITVPKEALQLHKYHIGLLQILPGVLTVPSNEALNDPLDSASNLWFDQTQVYAALVQKIGLETTRLLNQYK